ncbi:membrane protein of unknown function [Tenacibaculum sp. 190130A14a]|uniref:Group-specific protein n=1 Tax=Tenacibaculum polynesiense TaxID=3137857 RepID=A0ABM9P7J5_9FLAO
MTVFYPIPLLIVTIVIASFLIILIRKKSMMSKSFFRNFLMFFLSISFLSGIALSDFDKNGSPFLYLSGAIVIALSITYVNEE